MSDKSDRPNVVLPALGRLMRGDRSAVMAFAGTPNAVLRSLVPLSALPVVSALGPMSSGQLARGLAAACAGICSLLLPLIVTHLLARWWKVEPYWMRYATASNWCRLALAVISVVALVGGIGLLGIPTPDNPLPFLPMVATAFYGLWLHWFVAKHALRIGGLKAAFTVFAEGLCVVALFGVSIVVGRSSV